MPRRGKQKGFRVLKKELVNELFTFLREVNQEAAIAKFARSDQYCTISHVITNPEKNTNQQTLANKEVC